MNICLSSSLWPQLEDNENKQIKGKFAFSSLTAANTVVDFVVTVAFVLCCRHFIIFILIINSC
jgi:hypothetical protein